MTLLSSTLVEPLPTTSLSLSGKSTASKSAWKVPNILACPLTTTALPIHQHAPICRRSPYALQCHTQLQANPLPHKVYPHSLWKDYTACYVRRLLFPPRRQREVLQEVIGVFLYYARVIDVTMLPSLSKMASQQAQPTESLYHAVLHFLQYAATPKPSSATVPVKCSCRSHPTRPTSRIPTIAPELPVSTSSPMPQPPTHNLRTVPSKSSAPSFSRWYLPSPKPNSPQSSSTVRQASQAATPLPTSATHSAQLQSFQTTTPPPASPTTLSV